jgi:hypothetical protein
MIQALHQLERRAKIMKVRLEAIEAKLIRMRENKSAVTKTAARSATCTKESGYRCSIG